MTTIYCHTCEAKKEHALGDFGVWKCQTCGATDRQVTRVEWSELQTAL